MRLLAAAVLAAGLATAAAAQTPPPPGPQPAPGLYVLKAARLFDATNGQMRADAMVVVRDGRIVSVGGHPDIPAGAQVIDLGDATLMPGLIDVHEHLTLEPDANYYRKTLNELMRSPAEQAFYAAANARKDLEAGVTTVRHVGARYFIDVALSRAIDAGLTPGPRMLTSANPITAIGGSCDAPPFPEERVAPKTPHEGVCSGPDQCRAAVREQIRYGATVIKICVSGGVLSYDPVDVPQLTPEEIGAVINEAHNWGRKVAAHAHGDTAARYAVEAGVDSIEHGSFLTEATLKLMKQKGTFLVPTRTAVDWVGNHADDYPPLIAAKARAAFARHADTVRMAMRLGVPIAAGTDASVRPDGHGRNAMEMVLLTQIGMAPGQALEAGTREGARLMGLDHDIGTLEPGKLADIIAVPGDPLADIKVTEHVSFVMQGGRIVVGRP